ncbi:MAG: hypothetical protein WBQ94_02255 [Terracidiphilus sp.]
MLDVLEGRLKWKRTPEGIFVSIPPRNGTLTILYGPLVGTCLLVAAIYYWRVLMSPHPEDTEHILQLVAVGIYVFGFFFAVCWLIWTFTNETVLILNKSEMKIQRRVLGVELATRSFPNRQIHDFRFIPPTRTWASQGSDDPKTSRIQFHVGSEAHFFADGVSAAESDALFARLQSIYRFPGYLGLTHQRLVL